MGPPYPFKTEPATRILLPALRTTDALTFAALVHLFVRWSGSISDMISPRSYHFSLSSTRDRSRGPHPWFLTTNLPHPQHICRFISQWLSPALTSRHPTAVILVLVTSTSLWTLDDFWSVPKAILDPLCSCSHCQSVFITFQDKFLQLLLEWSSSLQHSPR